MYGSGVEEGAWGVGSGWGDVWKEDMMMGSLGVRGREGGDSSGMKRWAVRVWVTVRYSGLCVFFGS
jgi:hypothetical protein